MSLSNHDLNCEVPVLQKLHRDGHLEAKSIQRKVEYWITVPDNQLRSSQLDCPFEAVYKHLAVDSGVCM